MNYNNSKAALVTYESREDAEVVYNVLKDNEKSLHNTRIERMQVTYVFDLRKMPSENWVAVVLRNLPTGCKPDLIKTNFEKTQKVKILAIESLR